jgi:hypothetical protein
MDRSHEPAPGGKPGSRKQRESGAPYMPPGAARALALQRAAGNRATALALARWAAHPDKEKKGAVVPDSVAEDLMRFDPPKNT